MSSDQSRAALSSDVPSADPRGDFRVDGVVPGRVLAPTTLEELSEIVAAANAAGETIIPWGGGTQMGLGNIAGETAIALDLARLDAIVDYEPDDLTLAVQAGRTLTDLNRLLGEHGQMLPVETANPERATIGGLFAAGISGPRRYGYGSLRDLIIGLTAVRPDGRLSKGGGMVVKNVSGFDMMRLHHGALGAFGIIVQLNFKIIPRPLAQRTVLACYATLDAASEAGLAMRSSQLGPTAIVLLDAEAAGAAGLDGDGWWLALRGEAPPAAAELQAERTKSAIQSGAEEIVVLDQDETEAIWPRINHALSAASTEREITVRVGAMPTGVRAVLNQVGNVAERAGLGLEQMADLGTGIVYARLRGTANLDALSSAWQALSTVGVHATLLAASPLVKAGADVFGREPEGMAVTRALKRQFDPNAILNRGRFVGRL